MELSGIRISMDPVLARLGTMELRWYGVAVLLALTAAYLTAVRESRRRGLPEDIFSGLLPWLAAGGLIGARLFHVIDLWDFYLQNPLYIFQLHRGGLAIWGALAGGAAAGIIYARSRQLPLGRLADTAVPALLVGQMIGRIGCIINGDAYGAATQMPWGFIYLHPGALLPADLVGVPTHPYPVYEIIWNGMILVIILSLRRTLDREGHLFFLYLALYSVGRFTLSFFRNESLIFFGLQQAQIMALVGMAVASSLFLLSLNRTGKME